MVHREDVGFGILDDYKQKGMALPSVIPWNSTNESG